MSALATTARPTSPAAPPAAPPAPTRARTPGRVLTGALTAFLVFAVALWAGYALREPRVRQLAGL